MTSTAATTTKTTTAALKATLETYAQRKMGMSLDEIVHTRHASRWFKPTPVPTTALRAALDLASHAPSNSNIQPWRLFVITDGALAELKTALVAASSSDATPSIPALPAAFQHFRSDLGRQVYGEGWGVPRNDAEARRVAVLRNFEFFGAPVGVLACIDRTLAKPDVVSLGMYLQTFLLGLTERGVQSIVEVSVAGYPEVIRQTLKPRVRIPAELDIVAGIAVGYEDESLPVNCIRSGRVPVDDTVTFVQ